MVAERRSKMAAPPVENLGVYNPSTKAAVFKKDRVAHWVKMGAQPTVSVHNLLVAQGILSVPTRPVKMKKAVAAVAAPAASAPAAEPVATAASTEEKA